jgi:predicted phosphodiesterase
MKITCISDTHNKHGQIPLRYLAGGDMIIHSGDMTGTGTRQGVIAFLNWFSALPYTYKILIAGNHDWYFERAPIDDIEDLLSKYPDVSYLNDSGIEVEGFKIWGSPVQPWFCNWAFNRKGEVIQPHWDMIPLDTNILITHGPIYGYLDLTLEGDVTGCPRLLNKVKELNDLRLHVCGHIHEAYGRYIYSDKTEFVNASVVDRLEIIKNTPIEIIIVK